MIGAKSSGGDREADGEGPKSLPCARQAQVARRRSGWRRGYGCLCRKRGRAAREMRAEWRADARRVEGKAAAKVSLRDAAAT